MQDHAHGVSPEERYFRLLARHLTAVSYPESGWVQRLPGKVTGMKRWVADPVLRYMERQNHVVLHRTPFDARRRVNGEDWPLFGYTMVGLKRLENIHRAVGTVLDEGVPGDLFECGVWRGGCLMMMAAVLDYRGVQDRTVWGADSFEGMPKIDAATMPEDAGYDLSSVAILSVGEQQVRRNFSLVGIDDARVKLVKGWFGETLPHVPVERIAVLRLDGDHYSSTMDILANLYDKVSPGGFVIVDDYKSWPPCKQAISEFLAGRGLAPEIIPIDDHGVYWRV